MKNKYYCFHAHFDVPARENPWLEEADPDPSAAPYRDAFERAFHECYGPNSAAALPGEDGRALDFFDNYGRMSFDFGPALLAWIEREHPRVYERILSADRRSRGEQGGHGNAVASPYPSLILPLASLEDKRTAVRWGLGDFEGRFGRPAEGLWLPENAADEETMEVLAEEGVRFTLLSAAQAHRVRPIGSEEEDWLETAPETLLPTRPYRWRSRKRAGSFVDVFFYRTDLSLSAALGRLPTSASAAEARDRLLDAGRRFTTRMIDCLTANDAVELTHSAEEGEWFGLHHPDGERALAWTLDSLEREAPAERVNYGRFLDLFPPPQEVELKRLSSRSCPHGVGRWSTDCGCGGPPDGQTARWRAPFRAALDWLAVELDDRFSRRGGELFASPARARDAYGKLAFSAEPAATQPLLDAESALHLTPEEARRALRLCELQRWRLKMLEHWAWRDRDVSDSGPVQALLAADRALSLLSTIEGPPDEEERLRKGFLTRLSKCPSTGTSYPNAAEVYRRLALPQRIDLPRAAAHLAVADHLCRGALTSEAALLEHQPPLGVVMSGATPACRRILTGRRRSRSLSVVSLSLRRLRTFERLRACAAVLHSGRTDIECWVLPDADQERCERIAGRLDAAFLRGSPESAQGVEGVRAAAAELFDSPHYGLDALFPSVRRLATRDLLPRGAPEWVEVQRECGRLARDLIAAPASSHPEEAGLAERTARVLERAAAVDFPPDALPGAPLIRAFMVRVAARFAAPRTGDEGSAALADLVTLLKGAEASGLHLNLWELRELGWRGLKRGGPDPEKLAGLARMLGLPGGPLPEAPEPVPAHSEE